MLLCGIDEAGKGPVIGDLVIAGCLIDSSKEKSLKDLGAKDSKLLSPKEREELFDKIVLNSKNSIVSITAEEIDSRNSIGCNLNTLECLKMAEIINKLKPDKVILDCPHPVPEKFKQELLRYLEDKSVEIIAEHKADFNHPIVGAASIIAKVTRDRRIREIEKITNIKVGSGYPGDPKTKEVLKKALADKNNLLNKYIRHSWNTCKNELASAQQKGLSDY